MTDTHQEHESRLAKLKKEKPWLIPAMSIVTIALIASGIIYFSIVGERVYIDKSMVSATTVSLSPATPGVLEALYVKEGDVVPENTPVARVGNEIIKTKTLGLITSVHQNMGELIPPGMAVVTMIDPRALRIVGQVDEAKGLADIHIGEHATFTVDAFGGKEYEGIVDDVSPTSRESGIAFSISDKRETKQFDIKVRFDIAKYAELKNGMSAKLWVYKDKMQ